MCFIVLQIKDLNGGIRNTEYIILSIEFIYLENISGVKYFLYGGC